jgi:hypothetical protein
MISLNSRAGSLAAFHPVCPLRPLVADSSPSARKLSHDTPYNRRQRETYPRHSSICSKSRPISGPTPGRRSRPASFLTTLPPPAANPPTWRTRVRTFSAASSSSKRRKRRRIDVWSARLFVECVGSALALLGIERVQSEMPVQPVLGGGEPRVPGPLVMIAVSVAIAARADGLQDPS